MNVLDEIISYVSPERGLRRARNRLALGFVRSYEGSKNGRRSSGWFAPGTSANSEIAAASTRLRNNGRDLVRNSPIAKHALHTYVGMAIGTGITPAANTGSDGLDKQIDAAFEEWCEQCDANGLLDFYGLQAQVAAGVFQSGETLTRFRPRRPDDGLAIPLQLQVLEADFLDTTKDGLVDPVTMQGIEFNKIGGRQAYWIYDQHPGDRFNYSLISKRIPASEIVHTFDPLWRPGQMRGVTAFDAVMAELRDLGDYRESEAVRKKIESCFAAFVTSVDGAAATLGQTTVDGKNKRYEQFEPGMIAYLPEGQDVRIAEPKSNDGYSDYMKMGYHNVAVGVDLTYAQLTGDLSDVNYSSMKGGKNDTERLVEMAQWHIFIKIFCKPVWRRFIDTAVIAGRVRKADYHVDWTPPQFQSVDRGKDSKADQLDMENGTLSLFEGIAARGKNPRKHIDDLAKIQALLKKKGLVIPTLAGNPPPAATAAASDTENDNG